MTHDEQHSEQGGPEEDAAHVRDNPKNGIKYGGRRRLWLVRLLLTGSILCLLGLLCVVIFMGVVAQDLPELRSLEDYRPLQANTVYGSDGQLAARFAKERRTVVPYDRIPKMMIQAVVASEDAQFFEHEGLDYLGILRCFVRNILSRRIACGGSTITQQTVKTFFLSSDKKLIRKQKEVILAKRLEESLTKDEILYLYLNQIYFGHGAYGIQEASRVYFGKDVADLELAQMALLAGLPQSPSRLDPYRHKKRAIQRRSYVLGRLKTLGIIDEASYQAAHASDIVLDHAEHERTLDSSSFYAARVKSELARVVGEEEAKRGGYKVYAGIDPQHQKWAERALRSGLRAVDKRQGFRGALLHLEPDQKVALFKHLGQRFKSAGATSTETTASTIFDLAEAQKHRSPRRIAEHARPDHLELERIYGGIVVAVDDPGRKATVGFGTDVRVHLPLGTGLSWARKFHTGRSTPRPKKPSDVLRVGDIVLVRATAQAQASPKGSTKLVGTDYLGVLEQHPRVQGALVAISPMTREIRALVGGYGKGAGAFNRAVVARRQAGSTFKPMVYAAAFETGQYSPISLCLDAPRVYRDPWTGRTWKPENYDRRFDGEITLRTALTRSKNLCSVELIDKIGVQNVIALAKRMGIRSALPRTLTLALGSGDVTVLEMVNSYATLAAGGEYQEPVLIRKIIGPNKEVVYEAPTEKRQALKPEIAYQVTSLMQSVVQDGTARRVKALKRPVAGKTGTTNEARNAWFLGFTPQLVAGVWVGFDNNDPLGRSETGGRAAIPIWLEFMEKAVKGTPPAAFLAPQGIVFAVVDPKTGKLATPDLPHAQTEPFVEGTEPTEYTEPGEAAGDFGLDDYE